MSDKAKPPHNRDAKYADAATKVPKPSRHGAKTERPEKETREDRWR